MPSHVRQLLDDLVDHLFDDLFGGVGEELLKLPRALMGFGHFGKAAFDVFVLGEMKHLIINLCSLVLFVRILLLIELLIRLLIKLCLDWT